MIVMSWIVVEGSDGRYGDDGHVTSSSHTALEDSTVILLID